MRPAGLVTLEMLEMLVLLVRLGGPTGLSRWGRR